MTVKHPELGIGRLTGYYGRSRQAYYRWLERQRLSKDEQTVQTIIELVDAIRRQLPKIGARKLLFLLMDQLATRGITIGRDRFFRVLREHGLLVYPTRPFKVHTTNSKHWYRKNPNLIK